MSDVLTSPPRTIMQVFKMLPEGTLAEVIDNTLYMSPAPTPFHQRILGTLFRRISDIVDESQLGEVFIAPVDVYLDEESNAVEPDILFVSKDNPLRVDREGLHGTPDLIIEILSPSNRSHDTLRKKSLYERFGVKEYWVVDPDSNIATGYSLHDGVYRTIAEENARIRSVLYNREFSF
jgi:Uma2 family endonuclease